MQATCHEGMDGDLSIVDSDHFDKLKHFYEKLGSLSSSIGRETLTIGSLELAR